MVPLYPEMDCRHRFIEVIDAPTDVRRYPVADRNVIVIGSGPYGYPASNRRARETPSVFAVNNSATTMQFSNVCRSSAMFAGKSREVEQELPKGIREPRNVTGAAWRRSGQQSLRTTSSY
jgi:hypothetical protein